MVEKIVCLNETFNQFPEVKDPNLIPGTGVKAKPGHPLVTLPSTKLWMKYKFKYICIPSEQFLKLNYVCLYTLHYTSTSA